MEEVAAAVAAARRAAVHERNNAKQKSRRKNTKLNLRGDETQAARMDGPGGPGKSGAGDDSNALSSARFARSDSSASGTGTDVDEGEAPWALLSEHAIVVSALLAAFALDVPSDHAPVAKLLLWVCAALNLASTCSLSLVSFYLRQMADKNRRRVGDFRRRTKWMRVAAQKCVFFTVPVIVASMGMCAAEGLAVQLVFMGLGLLVAAHLYYVSSIFHALRHNFKDE